MLNEIFAGVDIGGTKCAVVLARTDDKGIHFLGRKQTETKKINGDAKAKVNYLICMLNELCQACSIDCCQLTTIGICCGGPLDCKIGVILSPPNLPGWENAPISQMFSSAFGVPVKLMNDADAGALSEWMYGAGKGLSSIVFLTFGTGCGAGMILNGKLYSGAAGLAGECGHIRLECHGPVGYGKIGSMEGFCSGGGIKQLAASMALERLQRGETTVYCHSHSMLEDIDVKAVAQAAIAGDITAKEVFCISGEMLGRGLSVIVDLLNPDMIIIGGIYHRCLDLIEPSMYDVLSREVLPSSYAHCKICPSELKEHIGDYAAIAAAQFYEEKS